MSAGWRTFGAVLLWGLKLAAFVAGAVLVMVLALFWTVGRHFDHVDATVPEVVGMTQSEADEALSAQGLVLRVGAVKPHESVEAGRVVVQDPAPGTATRRRRAVVVTISAGRRAVTTPDLVGRSRPEATMALHAAGLEVGDVLQVHARTAANSIVAQSPRPGDVVVEEGRAVGLLVSLGPPRRAMVMPDLRGVAAADAERLLARAGLRIVDVQQVQGSPGAVPGTIQTQAPVAGSRVFRDTPVLVSVVQRSAAPGTGEAGPATSAGSPVDPPAPPPPPLRGPPR